MDGNGRWARRQNLPRVEGHKRGTDVAKAIVTRCSDLGVGHLTLYTFSKENWARPADEVRFLFDLLVRYLKNEVKSLIDQDIRMGVLGELSGLPPGVRHMVSHVCSKTRNCRSMRLNLALNYSGRDEILRACRNIAAKNVPPEDIDDELFSDHLYTAGQPDPDLIIRTSGEMRLSNYLLFQAAYAELYFTDTLWPDFTPEELEKALADYAGRQRRFGKTGDQAE